MPDNTILSAPIGTGDAIRDIVKGDAKTQVVVLDVGGSGEESLIGDGAALPISAAALPLPSGASTEASLASCLSRLAEILAQLQTTLSVAVSNLPATQPVSGSVSVNNFPLGFLAAQSGTWTVTGAGGSFPVTDSGGSLTVDAPVGTPVFVRLSDGSAAITTLPVSMAAVPTGGATATLQTTGNTSLSNIDTRLTLQATVAKQDVQQATLTSIETDTGTIAGKDFATQATLDTLNGKVTACNTGAVAVTSIVPGVGATSLGKAEDAASADGDTGVGMLAVRKATPANTSGNDGDYEFLQISAGRLWCSAVIDTALPAGANVIGAVTQSGTWDVGQSGTWDVATVSTVTTVEAVTSITNVVHVDDNAGSLTVDNAGTFAVQASGNVAAGATDAGNPVKTGGYASATIPTAVTVGQRANAWYTLSGLAMVATLSATTTADGASAFLDYRIDGAATFGVKGQMLYNPVASGWDRYRNNHSVTLVASAAQTVTFNSGNGINYNHRGVILTIDITVIGVGNTLTVQVQRNDDLTGYSSPATWVTAALAATGRTQLTIYPGITVAANVNVSDILSRTWRCVCTIGGASPSITFSISATYIL